MNATDFIVFLSIASMVFAVLFVVYYFTAEQYHERNAKLSIQLTQANERARAAEHRANLHKAKWEQSEAARKSLRNQNAELAAEKRYLQEKVKMRTLEQLVEMALMDASYYPRLPEDGGSTINLN